MMLGLGSIEWGSKRSALEKFAYTAGDLALCDRHQGEWVGLMNVPHLQLGISDAALMAASDEPNGEVELRLTASLQTPAWCAGYGCSRRDGSWVSERPPVSGFYRTGHGGGFGQCSGSKASSCAAIRGGLGQRGCEG